MAKKKSQREPFWKKLDPELQHIGEHIGKIIDNSDADQILKLGLFGLGTVVTHNLNLGGLINYFGRTNEFVDTGLPYPFARRRKFPWEAGEEKTWEDQVCEWGLPAILSYILIYKPEAAAKFVDAIIPF